MGERGASKRSRSWACSGWGGGMQPHLGVRGQVLLSRGWAALGKGRLVTG